VSDDFDMIVCEPHALGSELVEIRQFCRESASFDREV
jgi:hypothetical protein